MAFELKVSQFMTGTVEAVDRFGNPAVVEDFKATSSDESVFQVAQNPEDPMEIIVTATGVGVAQLDYSADVDLGEGVKTISGFAAIEVQAEEAVGFKINFTDPQDQ